VSDIVCTSLLLESRATRRRRRACLRV